MTKFEESVRDIVGLTDFKLGTLPEWFLERLTEKPTASDRVDSSDAERVASRFGSAWLGEWGAATFNGNQVFLFEFEWDHAYDRHEPDRSAYELNCGLREVDGSNGFGMGTTGFFTEHSDRVYRRKSANTAFSASEC